MTAELKNIGAQMANVMFNLAQRPGEPLTGDLVATMDKLRKQWDAAVRATPPSPSTAPTDRNSVLEEAAKLADTERAEFTQKAGDNNGRESDFAFGSVNSAERIAAAIRALKSDSGAAPIAEGELPPLPEPDFMSGDCTVGESAYTDSQMRAYGQECARAGSDAGRAYQRKVDEKIINRLRAALAAKPAAREANEELKGTNE